MNKGTLWYLKEPLDTSFAQAGGRSPDKRIVPALCARCGRGARYVTPRPLILEWEPGADVIGDFTWPGGGRVAVKRTVFDILARKFSGFHAENVEMVQDPKLKRPKRPASRSKPRIWLPYTGPELVELWPDCPVPFLPATTFEVAWRCEDCGNEPLQLSGIELKMQRYDSDTGELVPDHHPRVPGKGVFVSASAVGDHPIFRLTESAGTILCTDEVKSFVLREGFTNVDFGEYGDVVEP